MSVNMFLDKANLQVTDVAYMCAIRKKWLEAVKTAFLAFIHETGLKGKAYQAAQQYFEQAYIPLLDGMLLLNSALKRASEQLVEYYKIEVDSNSLQEEILRQQISRLNQLIDSAEQLMVSAPKGMMLHLDFEKVAIAYQEQKQKEQEKLDKLLSFDLRSGLLFKEAEQLMSSISGGLEELNRNAQLDRTKGMFYLDKLNLEWARPIKQEWALNQLEDK